MPSERPGMSPRSTSLPSFRRPPVVEVVLGVQFGPLMGLQTPQVGLLWSTFRTDFPKTQELPALEPVFEMFGTRGPFAEVKIDLVAGPPPIRFFFVNDAETDLVQVQRDRFIRNWRRRQPADAYPRYHQLRHRFESDFQQFLSFTTTEGLGEVQPNQCEVTYVDVLTGEDPYHPPRLSDFVTLVSVEGSEAFLPAAEEIKLLTQYVMTDNAAGPVGRLYCSIEPLTRATDDRPGYLLRMTARGHPRTPDLAGVMEFFDLGHDWIVRGFTSVTTRQAHQLWGRDDDA